MTEKPARDYQSEAWIALRERILARDGNVCRNCGVGAESLDVHHWRPEAAFQHLVDELGYSLEGDPLLVHETGLVTLCADCHEALTSIRARNAILKNPKFQAVDQRSGDDRLNVFQIWALEGERLPFKVRKKTWSHKIDQYYRVTRIEIGRWPYGSAWGHYSRNGVEKPEEKISAAGVYDWELASDD